MALSRTAAAQLTARVAASARLEGQEIRPEATELAIAYGAGEIDEETYLERARANIEDLCRQHEREQLDGLQLVTPSHQRRVHAAAPAHTGSVLASRSPTSTTPGYRSIVHAIVPAENPW